MHWFKIYSYEWLEGSIRKDLTPAEQSVWVDLMATANMCRRRGHIERTEGIPYSLEELAAKYQKPIELVKAAIDNCLDEGRLCFDE